MQPCPTVSLVLIVRNEELGLRDILPRIPYDLFDDHFAVDGNSTDGSVAVLESQGVRVYQQSEQGLGAAMIEARGLLATDALIFFHPDGNEDPADLPRMVELLRQNKEFVVASRMIPGAANEDDSKILKWRKWANMGFALLANVSFARGGNRTTDVTNGFRGVTLAAWDKMNLSSRDLTMDFQMVIRALKAGIAITEFPTHEGHRIEGATNFASLPTGIAELKLVWREIRMGVRNPGRTAVGAAAVVPLRETNASTVDATAVK
jgi:glycosyltransferase involved in cell wall biosynthesis